MNVRPPWQLTVRGPDLIEPERVESDRVGVTDLAIGTRLVERAGTAVRDMTVALFAALVVCAGIAAVLGWTAASSAGALVGVGIVAAAGASVVARPTRWSGPADRVTLTRAVLIGACATTSLAVATGGLAARSWLLVALVVPTLLLDAVDGAIARRTGTASAAGGRLDGELDAAALMVLSLAVAPSLGWWVLAIGVMRYVFFVVGYLRPRQRGRLAFSQFRRVVAGLQGAVLVLGLSPVVPTDLAQACVAAALALLVVSFGRDVIHLERRAGPRP
jgi:phosphatidylglycerophosphate synthase